MQATNNGTAPVVTVTAAKRVRRAIALARAAQRGDEAARDKAAATLAAHCTRYGLTVADIIAKAAGTDDVERQPLTPTQQAARDAAAAKLATAAPSPEAAHKAANEATAKARGERPERNATPPKADKPSKPSAADAKRAADADARVKLVGALRETCAKLYNGPSLAVRSNPKRIAASVYADLLAAPKHRTSLDRVSVRDESFLFTVIQRGTKRGEFDPAALNLDSGIFSRLASVAYIVGTDKPGVYRLTSAALKHAGNAAKRAA